MKKYILIFLFILLTAVTVAAGQWSGSLWSGGLWQTYKLGFANQGKSVLLNAQSVTLNGSMVIW